MDKNELVFYKLRMRNLYWYLEKIIKIFLPVFYLLVAVSFYLRTYDSCQIKITIVQCGGSILIFLFLLKLIEDKFEPLKKNFIIILPLLCSLSYALISYFIISPEGLKRASMAELELVRRIVYVTIALVLISEFTTYEKIRRLIRWLFFAAFVSTSYGVIQFLDRKFFPGGMGESGGLDPFIWRQAFGDRIFSTFGNPNFYGDFLAFIAPIVLAHFLRTKNIFHLFLYTMVMFNVVFTYSKGAWIGTVAGFTSFCILALIFFKQFKTPVIRKITYGLLCGILLLCLYAVWLYTMRRTDSVKFRIYTWLSCWEMINTKPITGTGIGTFYVSYPAWRRPQIFFIEGKHNTESDHPENEYLEVWYDEGFIGFSIFLWIVFVMSFFGLKSLKNFTSIKVMKNKVITTIEDERGYLMLGLLSSFWGMLVHNFFCVSLRFVSSGVLLWLLFGLIGSLIANNNLYTSIYNPIKLRDRTILFLCVVAWMIIFHIWTVETKFILYYFIPILIVGVLLENNLVSETETNILKLNKNGKFSLAILASVPLLIALVFSFKYFTGQFYGDINHNIAIFFSKRAQWTEALKHYTIVHKHNPGFIMSHYFRGNVYNDRFDMNLTHHPEWGDRVIDAKDIEIYRKKYAKDIELGNRDFRYEPTREVYLEYRNDAQRSLDAYDDTNYYAPNYVQSHHQRGLVYLKLGDHAMNSGDREKAIYYYQKSLHYFEKYRKIDPIFPTNYHRMAYVYLKLGDIENAKKVYEMHLDTPNMFKKVKAHSAAIEDWGRRRYHDYSETCFNYGNLMYMLNDLKSAEEKYKLALEYNPSHQSALKNLIALYQRLGRNEEIVQLAKKLQEIPAVSADREIKQLFDIYIKGVQ